MSAQSKNLQALSRAIVRHDGNCGARIYEIAMAPFEQERLGWDEFQGIPIVADAKLPTGRFELRCEAEHSRPRAPGATERVEA